MPGDTLIYRTVIEDIPKDGAIVNGTSHVGDRLQAEVELFFVALWMKALPANRYSIRRHCSDAQDAAECSRWAGNGRRRARWKCPRHLAQRLQNGLNTRVNLS